MLAVTIVSLSLVVGWFAFDTTRPWFWLGVGLLTGGALREPRGPDSRGRGDRLSRRATVAGVQPGRRRDHRQVIVIALAALARRSRREAASTNDGRAASCIAMIASR